MENLTLSENVIAVLDSVCEKMGIAVDWTAKNVMPELQRLMDCLVNFELATSIMWLCMGVAGIAICGIVVWRILWGIRQDDDTLLVENYSSGFDLTCLGFMAVFLGSILFIISATCVVVQITDIIKCCTFPELVVIDYITSYMGE